MTHHASVQKDELELWFVLWDAAVRISTKRGTLRRALRQWALKQFAEVRQTLAIQVVCYSPGQPFVASEQDSRWPVKVEHAWRVLRPGGKRTSAARAADRPGRCRGSRA